MKSLRKLFLGGMAAAALMMALPAAAQENTFGLSEADWALFTAAQGNAPETFSYEFVSTLNASIPESGNLSWNLNGTGVAGTPGFSMDVTGSLSMDGSELPATLNLRAVGDGLFVSVDGMQWIGGTGEEITELLSGFGSMLPVDPTALMNDPEAASELMAQPGMMEAMMGLSQFDAAQYTSIVRNADTDGLAYFTTTVDLGGIIAAPELAPLIMQSAGAASGMDASGMTSEQMAQMGDMMSEMFSGSSLTLEQWIDPATSTVRQANLNLSLNVAAEGETMSVVLSFQIALDDAAGATIEAPAEYEPFSSLMSMFMGGMGMMNQ
jgi:hypothetical protein